MKNAILHLVILSMKLPLKRQKGWSTFLVVNLFLVSMFLSSGMNAQGPCDNPPVAQTECAETVCGMAFNGAFLTLCAPQGKVFTRVIFASYGNPTGSCDGGFQRDPDQQCTSPDGRRDFIKPGCHAANSVSVVASRCIGNNSCTFFTSYFDPVACSFPKFFVMLEANSTETPVISCPSNNLSLQCGASNNESLLNSFLGSASATGMGSTGQLTHSPTNFNLTTCRSTTVTFRATNDCGNSATCTQNRNHTG